MSTRVWVVSELYYPEETSTGHVMTGIAEAIAGEFDVRVLTIQPTYSKRGVRAPDSEVRNGVRITRCAATTFDRRILFLRLLNLVTITASLFRTALLKFRRRDLVLVVTNPPSLPFVIALVCRLRGARCLLLVHDVYPEVMVAVGMTAPNSLLSRGLRLATRILYRSVSGVVTIGRDMQSLVRRKAHRNDDRIRFIANWADEDIEPRQRPNVRLLAEMKFDEQFVVEYAGNIGAPNDFDTMLAAAERLSSRNDITFLILGSGAREAALREEIGRRRISNVVMTGSRPRSEQSDFLGAADLALISLRRGMLGVSMPSRTYNTMASQRPILAVCEPDSELWCMVNEERIGWTVAPGDVDGFVAAVLSARDEPALRAEMGGRARAAALNRYSRGAVLDQWRALFREVAAERPA